MATQVATSWDTPYHVSRTDFVVKSNNALCAGQLIVEAHISHNRFLILLT
jgi:hypothetical protein